MERLWLGKVVAWSVAALFLAAVAWPWGLGKEFPLPGLRALGESDWGLALAALMFSSALLLSARSIPLHVRVGGVFVILLVVFIVSMTAVSTGAAILCVAEGTAIAYSVGAPRRHDQT